MTPNKWAALLAAALAWMGCGTAGGPPAEVVEKAAQALFERAARGETAAIPFTGQGPSAPRLLSSELTARREVPGSSGLQYECDVRLNYLNRIQQMEIAVVTIRFERRGENWRPLFPPASAGAYPFWGVCLAARRGGARFSVLAWASAHAGWFHPRPAAS